MDIIYHYPPELLALLIDTIPLLCRSKMDTILFFKGAGVSSSDLSALEARVVQDRQSINKYEIAREALSKINERGESTLRERREILKRVCEFESFVNCWPNDQLKAKGLVSEIQRITNVKDSFTRMKIEKDKEKEKTRVEYNKRIQEKQKKKDAIQSIKDQLFSLFNFWGTPQQRGKILEDVMNSLFKEFGFLIRESFTLVKEEGEGIAEQVDGVVEIDGSIYLVEMKWTKDPIDINPISRHLVRVYHRGCTKAIFISASGYTQPAINICKEALQNTVVVLSTLEEIVNLLERENDLKDLYRQKINFAIVDKNPLKIIT